MYDMYDVYDKIQVGGAKIKKFTFQFLGRVKNVYTSYIIHIQQHGVRTPLYGGSFCQHKHFTSYYMASAYGVY